MELSKVVAAITFQSNGVGRKTATALHYSRLSTYLSNNP
jgi:hypothetical protein